MKRGEKIEKFFREEIDLDHIDIMNYIDVDNVSSFKDVFDQVEEKGGGSM